MADLLRRQAHSIGGMHRLEHVFGEGMDFVVDFVDPLPFRPQNRVAVFPNWQSHFPSRVNAGKFFTPGKLQRVHHFDDRAE